MMDWKKRGYPLAYTDSRLCMDDADLEQIAREHGTPLYVYSEKSIVQAINEFRSAAEKHPILVCYAVKANSSSGILQIMAREKTGADIVSGGELFRALRSGIQADKIVYSGVGKTRKEIQDALDADILLFSVESEMELAFLAEIASEKKRIARVSIRVNPEVDAGTHPYISTGLKENKFGVEHSTIHRLYQFALDHPALDPVSIGFHIGSQLTSLSGYEEAVHKLKVSIRELKEMGVGLRFIDVGGGLGIHYQGEKPPEISEYVRLILDTIGMPELTIIFEPGRRIIGNAGVFLTRILFSKKNGEKVFQICDGAMNDLIRPSLYQGYHEVIPVNEKRYESVVRSDLVGPICETGDFLARDRNLPSFSPGDLVALASAGAYGSSMSSNYNSRPRAAEVLVGLDGRPRLIRKRETLEDLVRLEVE